MSVMHNNCFVTILIELPQLFVSVCRRYPALWPSSIRFTAMLQSSLPFGGSDSGSSHVSGYKS